MYMKSERFPIFLALMMSIGHRNHAYVAKQTNDNYTVMNLMIDKINNVSMALCDDFRWSEGKQQQAQELRWWQEPAQGWEWLSQGKEHFHTWLLPHPQMNPPLAFPHTPNPPPIFYIIQKKMSIIIAQEENWHNVNKVQLYFWYFNYC